MRSAKALNRVFITRVFRGLRSRGSGGLILCCTVVSRAAEPDGGIEVIQVRPNFYMIAGGGGNVGVQIRLRRRGAGGCGQRR